MKIRTLFFLTLFLTAGATVTSQSFKADFSKSIYDMHNFYSDGIQTKQGRIILKENIQSAGGLIEVYVKKKASILLKDDKMETVKEIEIPFKNSMFINLKGLYQLKGKTIVLYSYKNDKKETEYTVSAIKLNEADNSIGEEVELGKYQTFSGRNMPDFMLAPSIDSSKYLLFEQGDQKNGEDKKFSLAVFDNDLKKIYEKKVQLPMKREYTIIESATLDNSGNVYVAYRQFVKELSSKETSRDEDGGYITYKTGLLQYAAEGKPQGEVSLGLQDKFPFNVNLLFDAKTGKMSMAGTYKNEEKGRVSGVFCSEYDPASMKVSNIKSSEIPGDLITLFAKEDIAYNTKKYPGLSGRFSVKGCSFRNNGTLDYILEYNRREGRSSGYVSAVSGNTVSTPYYKYYSQSILSVNINRNGKMMFTRIPKFQTDDNYLGYISHFSFNYGNKLIFLYNDDEDNAERDETKVPEDINMDKNSRKSVLVAAIVDENGNLRRQVIYNHREDKEITLIHLSRLITPNTLAMFKNKTGSFLADIVHYKNGIIEMKD